MLHTYTNVPELQKIHIQLRWDLYHQVHKKFSMEEVTGKSATGTGESHHQEEQLGVPHMELQLIYSFDVVNSFTSSSPVRSPRSMDATNLEEERSSEG